MTAIAAVFAPDPRTSPEEVARLLAAMRDRGSIPTTVSPAGTAGRVSLGATVLPWQVEWVGSGVGTCRGVLAVADATLYYRDDLRRALRAAGVVADSDAPAALIAAAVAAWGDAAVDRLEGDFAFVAFDARRGRLLAARDWGGLRPLYLAVRPSGVAVATDPRALARLPGVDARPNLPWIAEAMSARFEARRETVYRGVEVVEAGWQVAVDLPTGARLRLERQRRFVPPTFLGEERPAVPFDEAREELRRLMDAAVRERLPAAATSVVGLSGGRDSTAVYALARRAAGERVGSVSVSYPASDPGWEDDVIRDVLQQCGGEARWLRANDLGVLDALTSARPDRPEPFAHLFAEFQDALARGARAQGARVLLNGSGGDQLFSGEPTYLADLLRDGHWGVLRDEWRALGGGRDLRAFFRLAVWPNLGPVPRGVLAILRGGRPVRDPFDAALPAWLRAATVDALGLAARHARHFPDRAATGSAAAFERTWLLTHPYFPRVFAEAFRLYLTEGVELRTPLMDRRLLVFAATRPRDERRTGWQVKRLMRACLTDLLPESVTGDRHRPTGTTEGLLRRHATRVFAEIIASGWSPKFISDNGLIDHVLWDRIVRAVAAGREDDTIIQAASTVLADRWLSLEFSNGMHVAQ